MDATVSSPVSIALVNDYDIVVMDLAHILSQYQDRVVIAELDTNMAVHPRRRHRDQRPTLSDTQHRRTELARTQRGTHRPRIRDLGTHHPRQKQRRGGNTDLPQPQHRDVLHPNHLPQKSRLPAAPRQSYGESATASHPTITASNTGAEDPDRAGGTA
jgi:hypothetical protein